MRIFDKQGYSRIIIAISVAILGLAGCGGGGGSDAAAPAVGASSTGGTPTAAVVGASTASTPTAPAAGTTSSDPKPEIFLSASAPNDDLTAIANTQPTTNSTTFCNNVVGTSKITGVVSAVHDGDTITVNGKSVRLDSIDAPELTQTYGKQSQQSLSALVLGKTVTVAYTKTDKYGRIVGSVFTSSCEYVNLKQVAVGAAWFYRAYQCEISASARNAFAFAEDAARNSNLGLWGGVATPPWVYRNGVEPTVPVCKSDSPMWPGSPVEATSTSTSTSTSTPTPTTTTAPTPATTTTSTSTTTPSTSSTSTSSSGCYLVWVNGYTRADGTHVNGYYRRSPGCA